MVNRAVLIYPTLLPLATFFFYAAFQLHSNDNINSLSYGDGDSDAKYIQNGDAIDATPSGQIAIKPVKNVAGVSVYANSKDYTYPLYIVMPETKCLNSTNLKDQLIKEAAAQVTTSVVFEFSPLVDSLARKMFSNKVLQESWFELHPFQVACLPIDIGGFHCALRLWLHMDRFLNAGISNVRNRFQDSFVYALKLDQNLQFIEGSGMIVGIPTPVQDIAFTGPEDPRLFSINGTTYLNFVMAHSYDNVNFALRRQFIWSLDDSVIYDVQVNQFTLNEWEKNWTPWIMNNTLHFVYQFTPVTRVMRCLFQKPPLRATDCSFIIGQPPYGALSSTSGMLIRGGSPIVHYKSNYYIAITHSVQGYSGGRLYAAQLLIINGQNMQIVMISSPIFIDVNTMKTIDNLAGPTIKLPFVYARSVFVENDDSIIAAIGVNDNKCFLARLTGVAALTNEAILQDSSRRIACGESKSNEKQLTALYEQMNDWLRKKNLVEIESRFSNSLHN